MAKYNDAYMKERRRIQNLIRRATKRGYSFSDFTLPDIPKTITEASVRKLKKYTPSVLYKHATFTNPNTGQTMSGTEGRKYERSTAAKKSAETRRRKQNPPQPPTPPTEPPQAPPEPPQAPPDREPPDYGGPDQIYNTLYKIRDEIRAWTPSTDWSDWFTEVKREDKNILERTLDGAIASDGEKVVALRLEAQSAYALALVEEILYGSDDRDQVNFDIAAFSGIIVGRKSTIEDRINLEGAMEANESY